ncbi:transmembrane protein 116 [Centroberyx affinis]|uniref:transmembrane protein 116 n=1 Tax=Centroberyx affinis TaxID=166261 RepID=UPI003A5C4E4B
MSAAGSLEEIFTNSSQKNTTGAEDWTEVYEAVRWIQLVMAVLSILGSGSIIVYAASQKLIWTPELQPLLLLSVSDLLLALCWLVGAALFSQRCSGRHSDCYHLHTVEQILYMASFFYTLNYVWSLYTAIRSKFQCSMDGFSVQFPTTVTTASKITALVSGLLPVLLMTPVFIQGNISQCYANFSQPYRCLLLHTGALYLTPEQRQQLRPCSLLHAYRITVFLAAFLLTLIGIVMLMVKARHIYRRVVTSSGYLGDRQWSSFRVMDRRMLLYPSVFIFCWGPAVYLAAVWLAAPSSGPGLAGVVLYIAQAFTSGSQGFLNCLVYGWTHTHFRSAGRTVLSRDADTQTPLLRSQKRGYHTLRPTG